MKHPKVSIVMPSYNYGRFLKDAIVSILNQTFQSFEILVCDDASQDNTTEVMKEFQNHPKVKYIQHFQNVGQSENRNSGIRQAQGKYVAFLDADDTYEPNKLKEQVEFLDKNYDYGVVSCLRNSYNENLTQRITQAEVKDFPNGNVTEPLFINNYLMCPSIMVRKPLLDEVGGYPNKDETLGVGVDWRMVLELSTITKFHCLLSHSYNYRLHGDQMSSNYQRRIKSDRLVRSLFLTKHPNCISKEALSIVKDNEPLSVGYYYRINQRKGKALLEYLKYIINCPFSAVGYRAIYATLFGYTKHANH